MVYSKFLTYKFYLHVDISYLIIIKVLIPTMQIFNLKIHKTFEKKSQRIHTSEECQLCVKSTGLSHYIFPSSSFILALLLSFNFLFLCVKQRQQRARETVSQTFRGTEEVQAGVPLFVNRICAHTSHGPLRKFTPKHLGGNFN